MANLWDWFAADRMPLGDFPGYVAQMQYVRDALLRYGRVPLWCSECYGGTTNFTGHWKEVGGFPLAVWLGPLLATKTLFALLKGLSALGLYWVVVRLFDAPLAGLVAAAHWITALAWIALAAPVAVFRRAVASPRPPRRSPARTTPPPPSR